MITAGTKVKVGTDQLDYGNGEVLEFNFIGLISGKKVNIYLIKLESNKILQVAESLLTII